MEKDSQILQNLRSELLKGKISNNLTSIGFYNSFFKKNNDNKINKILKINSIISYNKENNNEHKKRILSANLKDNHQFSPKSSKVESKKATKKSNDLINCFSSSKNDFYNYKSNFQNENLLISENFISNFQNLNFLVKSKKLKKNIDFLQMESRTFMNEASKNAKNKSYLNSKYKLMSSCGKFKIEKEVNFNNKTPRKISTPDLKKFPNSIFKNQLDSVMILLIHKQEEIRKLNSPTSISENFKKTQKNLSKNLNNSSINDFREGRNKIQSLYSENIDNEDEINLKNKIYEVQKNLSYNEKKSIRNIDNDNRDKINFIKNSNSIASKLKKNSIGDTGLDNLLNKRHDLNTNYYRKTNKIKYILCSPKYKEKPQIFEDFQRREIRDVQIDFITKIDKSNSFEIKLKNEKNFKNFIDNYQFTNNKFLERFKSKYIKK